MPAARPRIVFTPDDRSMLALRRLAKMTGKPKSALVSEGVEILTDHFENLAGMLEKAAALDNEARSVLAAAAVASLREIEPEMVAAQNALARLGDVIDLLGLEPPSSNTGATSIRQGLLK